MLQRDAVGDDDNGLTDEHLRMTPEAEELRVVMDSYYKKAGESISNDEAQMILNDLKRIKKNPEEIGIIEEMAIAIPNSTFAAKLDILKKIVLPTKEELENEY